MLMFSLFGCFRKKPASTIDARLEELFPGQYQVELANLKMLDVMAQYKGEKKAVIAEKADPEVQFPLDWQKGSDTLGVDATTVRGAHERAKKDTAAGRRLVMALKQGGLARFSLGVIDRAAIIQVYAEPVASAREKTLRIVKAALDAESEPAQTSVFLEFMEPATYQTKFQEVIPRGHWLIDIGWQRDQKTVSLNFEWSKALKVESLARGWQINADAKRNAQFKDQAFQQAVAWSGKNLPKPAHLAPDKYSIEIPDDNGLTIRFGFPYFEKTPVAEDAEPSGYVCGRYEMEKGTFSQLRKQKEF